MSDPTMVTTVEEWTHIPPATAADRTTYNMKGLEGCGVEWPGSGGVWIVGTYRGPSASNRPMWECVSPHSGATVNVMIPSWATLAGDTSDVVVRSV